MGSTGARLVPRLRVISLHLILALNIMVDAVKPICAVLYIRKNKRGKYACIIISRYVYLL